jgi:stress-induced morphogen
MVTREYIYDKIKNSLEFDLCEVEDISCSEAKFKVLIVSSAFEGVSLLQRHRMIYEIFSYEMTGPIHALSLNTLTPAQWSSKNQGK